MRSVNKVILIWNVVHDPESKQTSSRHSFTSFVLATNREWFSSEWSNQSLAEFHKIVAWGKLADLCSKFLKKWKFIYIEWYLKTKVWEVEWKKMYRTEVVAQDMIMLNKRSDIDNEYQELDSKHRKEVLWDDYIPDEDHHSSSWKMDIEWDDI